MNRKLLSAACIVWAAIVFLLHVLKLEREADRIKLFPHSDKVVHFTMFFILAMLWQLAAGRAGRSTFLIILLSLAVYGACLEWLQGTAFVQRDCEWLDWLADITGTIVSLLFFSRKRIESISS